MNLSNTQLSKDILAEHRRAFSSDSAQDTFKFFKRYMQYYEDENGSGRHLFCLKNPLIERESNKMIVKEFDKKCLDFLYANIKSPRGSNGSLAGEAHAYLGMAYEYGLFGLRKNAMLAFNYYCISAQQNNALGTFRVAQCYEKGVGRPVSIEKALSFYRCSAKLGLIDGMHTYGSILLRGALSIKKELEAGIFYLKIAAKKSDSDYPYTYFDLGQCFESRSGPKEVEPDDSYAFRLYEKGANLDCPNCQYRLAKCYEYGELNQNQNMQTAIDWYRRSADTGNPEAQYILSKFFCVGIDSILGVNLLQAYMMSLKAAAKGHSEAALLVAEYYENDLMNMKDILSAFWWYSIADAWGNKKASAKLKELAIRINRENDGVRVPRCFWFC